MQTEDPVWVEVFYKQVQQGRADIAEMNTPMD